MIKKEKKKTGKIRKVMKLLGLILTVFFISILIISASPPLRVYASGWVEETTKVVAEYTKYPIDHYQLDFYVDTSWDWLPWNWGEGIGNTAYYAIYLLTNVFWILNAYLSYLMGFIVEQAYNLDFISSTISHLATNVQTIAGIDSNGFKTHGLLPSLFPIMIVLMGVYLVWVGIIKRQTTQAMNKLLTFVIIAVFGMGGIAYSKDYLTKINDFQKEFNTEVLTIGSKLTMDKSEIDTKNPVTAIRDSLFAIQIQKPYLLLQYGDSDLKVIGEERIDKLLKSDPKSNNSSRMDIVEEEVGEKNNTNMGFQEVPMRLGMVLVIFVVNLVIDFCVGVFCGLMIFSQVLFVLFVSFIPVAVAFSLLPNQGRILTKALQKTFNAVMQKAGITLIMTVVFSISSMCYSLSATNNFFWMMFLQIVVFIGSMMKINELLGFMNLNSNDSEQLNHRAGRFGRMGQQMLNYGMYRGLTNRLGGGKPSSSGREKQQSGRQRQRKEFPMKENPYSSEKAGEKWANMKDIPNKAKHKAQKIKDDVKDIPSNARYVAKKSKDDFIGGAMKKEVQNNRERTNEMQQRAHNRKQKREYVNRGMEVKKRLEGEKNRPTSARYERASQLNLGERKNQENVPKKNMSKTTERIRKANAQVRQEKQNKYQRTIKEYQEKKGERK